MIITIDGPVGTGKSTIARRLAREIGFIFFDTGALYRAMTYAILEERVDADDPQALDAFLNRFRFNIKVRLGKRSYWYNDKDVTDRIRSQEIVEHVSHVAALPPARETLVALQRELAKGVNAVFEGRDMGSVVFPNADLKIYLDADPLIRAQRRYDEILEKYPEKFKDVTLEKLLEMIKERDTRDMERKISPLKQAEDARYIDTSSLSIDQVIFEIMTLIEKL